MLTGKSPNGTCRPAGRSDHWFGNSSEPSGRSPGNSTLGGAHWSSNTPGVPANHKQTGKRNRKKVFFIGDAFFYDIIVCHVKLHSNGTRSCKPVPKVIPVCS